MIVRWLLVAVLAGMPVACLGDAAEVRAVLGDDPLQVTNYSDEVVVYVRDLDLLRARAGSLTAQVALDGDACAVDLAAPCQTPAIVVRKPEGAAQVIGAHAADVVAVHGDTPAVDVIEPREQVTPLPALGSTARLSPPHTSALPTH